MLHRVRFGYRVVGLLIGASAAAIAISSVGGVALAQSAEELATGVTETASGLGADVNAALVRRTGALQESQTRNLPFALRASQCAVVVARSASGILNLDVQIVRGRTVLTRDVETGTSASASFCAGPRAERLQARITAFRGHGDFAAGIFPRSAAGASASVTTTPEGGQQGLLDRIAARAREVGGEMQAVTPAARETITEGQRIERDLALVPGRCYRVVTVSDATVQDMDLAVAAPAGGELQHDATHDGVPTLGISQPLCPAAPGTHRLAIRMIRGGGAMAWQLLGSVIGQGASASARATTAFPIGGAGTDFVATRIRARHQAAGENGRALNALVTGELTTSLSRSFEVDAEAGHCYVVLGAGVPSVRELDLKVFDALGNELARDGERDAFPRARFCPTLGGRFRVEARMFQGYGPYGVQVFQVP